MKSWCNDECSLQDVIVKVTMSSICGSDMHPYAGRGVVLDSGITFGHEYTGIIVAVGDEVRLSLAQVYFTLHKHHDTTVAIQNAPHMSWTDVPSSLHVVASMLSVFCWYPDQHTEGRGQSGFSLFDILWSVLLLQARTELPV